WARYKRVRVEAEIVAHRAEDADAVRRRILERLHAMINPLPNPQQPSGWPFGQPLRAARVYDLLSEPGLSYVERVALVLDDGPSKNVTCVARDLFQPYTWYAASDSVLFRSMNDGEGWELVQRFEARVDLVVCHPSVPGLVAVSTSAEKETRLHISRDCGETWDA